MSDKCSFCNSVSETLEHLFITCKFTKRIWNFFRNCFDGDTNDISLEQ